MKSKREEKEQKPKEGSQAKRTTIITNYITKSATNNSVELNCNKRTFFFKIDSQGNEEKIRKYFFFLISNKIYW